MKRMNWKVKLLTWLLGWVSDATLLGYLARDWPRVNRLLLERGEDYEEEQLRRAR